MVRRENEKVAALAVAIVVLLLSFAPTEMRLALGVSKDSVLLTRLTYSFFHASFVHALINVWCFLSVVFLYKPKFNMLLLAFAITMAAPDFVLSDTPTVGLSAVCYAMLGCMSFSVSRIGYYQFCMAAYIGIGFLLPGINAWIHLYAYIAGMIVSLLNMPIRCKRT